MAVRRHPRSVALLVLTLVVSTVVVPSGAAGAGVAPEPSVIPGLEQADLQRPRITLRSGDLDLVRSRLDREPYRTLVDEISDRAASAPAADPDHQADCVQTANRDREAAKAQAARNLSFLYALDRVRDPGSGAIVQPTVEERQAIGDTVRDYLLFMCTESRIKVHPDRDINTSHELLQMASAYDNLAAGGYDFGDDEATIVDNLVDLTSEYFQHYSLTTWAGQFLVNNHLSKGAAAIGVAALVLAEYHAPEGTDPEGWRDPARWLDFALDKVDEVQRWTYGAGDGGYGEGPHYWRFSAINLYPFLRAWHDIHPEPWTTAEGVVVPDLWVHPQFLAMQRWLLDHTLPDGTLAPTDDNKVGERMFWGAAPETLPERGAYYWNWLDVAGPYRNTASIDLAVDEIVTFDDTVAVAPPVGSPTRFYPEGGSAVFRSDWSEDATMAVVLGEHGPAREFGRTREGVGQFWGAPHDHADPGSFLLHAFGERLLMDPGYRDYPWTLQWTLNKPSSHNMILVGPDPSDPSGESPNDPLTASTKSLTGAWVTTPGAAVPLDGNATIHDTFDSGFVDATTVTSRYGAPSTSSAVVERRFLYLDDRYLVVLDDVRSPVARTYTWPLHGNGGGSDGQRPAQPALSFLQRPPLGAAALAAEDAPASGGTFVQTATGGEWARPLARVTAGMAFGGLDPTTEVTLGYYEQTRSRLGSHDVLNTSITGADVSASSVLYPTPSGQAAPSILEVDGGAGLLVEDPGGDRRVLVVRASGDADGPLSSTALGYPVSTDGTLIVVDTHTDGTLRSVYAEGATNVTTPDLVLEQGTSVGPLGATLAEGSDVEVVGAGSSVDLSGSAVAPFLEGEGPSSDGACTVDAGDGLLHLDAGDDGRATVRTGASAGIPSAAVPRQVGSVGAEVIEGETRAEVGTTVVLDGRSSCDAGAVGTEGLTPHWEVVSAPSGSAWALTDASAWEPGLLLDVPGPYRVSLTVTDGEGNESLPVESRYVAGPGSADGEDGDLDGWFDAADSDGDGLTVAGLPATPADISVTSTGTDAEISWAHDEAGPATDYLYRVTLGDGSQLLVDPDDRPLVVPRRQLGQDPVTVEARNPIGWGPAASSGPPPPYCDAARFLDVGDAHPFCRDITWAADEGLVAGHPDGTYRPAVAVSRGALAAFLHRSAGSPLGPDPTCALAPFPDVPTTHAFCGEIAWAADEGITTGYVDGRYRPAATITRAAVAASLYRAAGSPLGPDPACATSPLPDVPTTHALFPDVPTAHPFCGEIAWLHDQGAIAGFDDGTYRPAGAVTRGSIAAILHRLAAAS